MIAYFYGIADTRTIRILNDFGRPNEHMNFNEHTHYIGPAVYGQIIHNLKYEAAYYFGVSDAASKGAAKGLLEYEMFFRGSDACYAQHAAFHVAAGNYRLELAVGQCIYAKPRFLSRLSRPEQKLKSRLK